MGFKRTTEGRVFFSNTDNTANDEAEYKTHRKNPAENDRSEYTQLQILTLLKSLNEKLKDSQVERKKMRKELDRYRSALEHMEENSAGSYEGRAVQAEEIARDTLKELEETRALILKLEEKSDALESRSDKADKAFLAMQNLGQEQAQRNAKTAANYAQLAKRLKEQEDNQLDITNRIEETVSQQARLVRKIDKAIEDRARFMRKIERIEETVIQTRDSLNAKAMVLLTDQGAAAHVGLEDAETLSAAKAPELIQAASVAAQAEVVQSRSKGLGVLMTILIAVACLLAGWFISEVQRPDLSALNIFQTDESIDELAEAMIERAQTSFETAKAQPAEQPWEVSEDVAPFSENMSDLGPAAGQAQNFVDPIDIGEVDDIGTLSLRSDAELLEAMGANPQEVASVMNQVEPGSQQIIEQEAIKNLEQEIEQKYAAENDVSFAPQVAPSNFTIDAPTGRGLASSVSRDNTLPEIIKNIEAQAFDGVAEAQHDLAAVYTAGHAGVRQDFRRGAYWFKKAADQGIANAAYNLGVLNHQGLGMEADMNEAIRWYNKAATQIHPEAQYNLGIAFIEGIGVPYDPARAARNFESAAQQGIKEAAYNLGLIYENGLLGRAQPDEALGWYKTAADAGSPEAQAALQQLAKSLNINIEDVNAIADKVNQNSAQTVSEPQGVVEDPKKKEMTEQPAQETLFEDTAFAPDELVEAEPLIATDDVYRAQEEKQILVAQIQEYLIGLGLFPGPADGAVGPLMEDAIRSYQSLNGLTTDGLPTQDLLSHMLASGGYEEGPNDLGSRAY